jgi:hypothetical protein
MFEYLIDVEPPVPIPELRPVESGYYRGGDYPEERI